MKVNHGKGLAAFRGRFRHFFFFMLVMAISGCGTITGGLRQRRFVLIDGGAYTGVVTKVFRTTRLYERYPWDIYAIEADPEYVKQFPVLPNVHVIPKAMWIDDGTVDFYKTLPGENICSSIYSIPSVNKDKITVDCFDFDSWVRKNFSVKDYIILSLDIEGAEYAILEKMMQTGTLAFIDRLYVEFHPQWFDSWEREARLIRQIRDRKLLFDPASLETVILESNAWKDSL